MTIPFDRLPELGWELGSTLLAAAIGVVAALAVHRLLHGLLARLARASESKADDIVVASLRRPTRYAMVALALVLAARETPLLAEVWQKLAGFVMPALIGWIALASLHAFVQAAALTTDAALADSQHARRRRRQARRVRPRPSASVRHRARRGSIAASGPRSRR